MSAFCVFGVSMGNCIETARKKVRAFTVGEFGKKIEIPTDEWNRQVTEMAAALFLSARAKQISPAFDAPEFCRDWIAVGEKTKQINRPKIMCKGPKVDAKGKPILRKGGATSYRLDSVFSKGGHMIPHSSIFPSPRLSAFDVLKTVGES